MSVTSLTPTAELLERGSECAALTDAVEATARGTSRLVLVEGHAGIGKSRLLGEASRMAAAAGLRVLRAAGSVLDQTAAFALARELLAPLAFDRTESEPQLPGGAALARPLFESPAHAGGRDAAAGELIPEGLGQLVAGHAARQPLALIVDDAHWADPASLGALLAIVRRLDHAPLLVLAAMRLGEPPAAGEGLDLLRAESRASLLRPAPLSAAAVAAMVRELAPDDADEELCARCHERTGGNPFLVTALLSSPEGEAGEAGDGPSDRLGMVARSVLLRADRLPGAAGALLRACAVLGESVPARHALALAGFEDGAGAAELDEIAEAGIVTPGEPIRFAHPLVREAVYAHLPPAWRADAHRDAACALRSEDAEPERVAAHLLEARPAAERWVVEALRTAAGQAGSRGVPSATARYLQRALAEPPPADLHGEVLLELGHAEMRLGSELAPDRLAAAAAAFEAGERAAEALLLRGRALYGIGDMRAAAEAFDAGLAALGDLRPELAAELEAGFTSCARFDSELAPQGRERLDRLLRDDGHPGPLRRSLLAEVALERGVRGAPRAEAIDLAERAWAGGELLGDSDPQGICLSQVAAVLTWSEADLRSEEILTHAIDHARRTGAPLNLATASYLRAWPRYYRGRIAEALTDVTTALETPGWLLWLPAARSVLAHALLDRGQTDAAAAALELPDGGAPWAGSIPYALTLEARGRLHSLSDRVGAITELEEAGRLLAAMECRHPSIPWRSRAGVLHASGGDLEQGVDLIETELAEARSIGLTRATAVALHARGQVEPDPQRALSDLAAAVAGFGRAGALLERARALGTTGTRLRREGDRDAARAALREALGIAHRVSAWGVAEWLAAELRAAGGRPRRRATVGPAALTDSELRAARLAAQGLSNAEIAEALFVTAKTVQFHLSNAYRKLGIESRDELASVLPSEGP